MASSIFIDVLILKYCTIIGKKRSFAVNYPHSTTLLQILQNEEITNIIYENYKNDSAASHLPPEVSPVPPDNSTSSVHNPSSSSSLLLSKEELLATFDMGIYRNGERLIPYSSTIEQWNIQNNDIVVIIIQEKALVHPLFPASSSSSSSAPPVHCLQLPLNTPVLHPVLASTLEQAKHAFDYGEVPHLAGDGLGGTYFLAGLVENPSSDPVDSSSSSSSSSKDSPSFNDEENTLPLPLSSSSAHYHIVNYVACFKPHDEEIETPANPRNRRGIQLGLPLASRGGWYSGEQYTREVAAYILDACSGSIHGVPPTTFVEGYHSSFSNISHSSSHSLSSSLSGGCVPKLGSFQIFLNEMQNIQNFGSKDFTDYEIQKIALLDLRIFNADRNLQNILHLEKFEPASFVSLLDATKALEAEKMMITVQQPNQGLRPGGGGALARRLIRVRYLTPIDHGLSLPDRINLGWADWEWLSWPQVKKPLHPRLRKAFLETNIDETIAIMRAVLGPKLRPACYTILRIADSILRTGILAGMTLEDIGNMIARKDSSMVLPSKIEKMLLFSRKQATHEALMASYTDKQLRQQQAFQHSNAIVRKKNDPNLKQTTEANHVLKFRKSPTLVGFSKELSSNYKHTVDGNFKLEIESITMNTKAEIKNTDPLPNGLTIDNVSSHPHPVQFTSIPIIDSDDGTAVEITKGYHNGMDEINSLKNSTSPSLLENNSVTINIFETLSPEYETIVAVAGSMTATRHASVLRGRTRARLRQQNGNALLSCLGLTNLLSSGSNDSSSVMKKLPMISICLAISADVQHQQIPNQTEILDPTLTLPNEARYGENLVDKNRTDTNDSIKKESCIKTITAINTLLGDLHILPSASLTTNNDISSPLAITSSLSSAVSSTVPTIADLFDILHTEVVTTLAVSIVWNGIVTIIVGTPVGKGITLVEDNELYTVCHALIVSALTTAVQKYNYTNTNISNTNTHNGDGPLLPSIFGNIVQRGITNTLASSSHVIGNGAWRTPSNPSSPLLAPPRNKSNTQSVKTNSNGVTTSPLPSSVAPTSPLLPNATGSTVDSLTNTLVLPPLRTIMPSLATSRSSLIRTSSWRHNSDLFNYDGVSTPFLTTGVSATDSVSSVPITPVTVSTYPTGLDPSSPSSSAVSTSPIRNTVIPSLSRSITYLRKDTHQSSASLTLPLVATTSGESTSSSSSSSSPSSSSQLVKKINQPILIPSPYRLPKVSSSFVTSPSALLTAHRDMNTSSLPSLASLRGQGSGSISRTNSSLRKFTPMLTPAIKRDGPFTSPWSTMYNLTSFSSMGISINDTDQPFGQSSLSMPTESSTVIPRENYVQPDNNATELKLGMESGNENPSTIDKEHDEEENNDENNDTSRYAVNPESARIRIIHRQHVLRDKYLLHSRSTLTNSTERTMVPVSSLALTTPDSSIAEDKIVSTVLPKVHVCAVVYSEQLSLLSNDSLLTSLNPSESMPVILRYAMDFARKVGSKVGEHLLSVVHKTVHPSPKHSSSYQDDGYGIRHIDDNYDIDHSLNNSSIPKVTTEEQGASSSDDSDVDGVMIHSETDDEHDTNGKIRDPSASFSLRKSLRISSDKLHDGLRNSSTSSLGKLSSSVCGFTFLFEVPTAMVSEGDGFSSVPTCTLLRVGEWSNKHHHRHHHRARKPMLSNPSHDMEGTVFVSDSNPTHDTAIVPPSTAALAVAAQAVVPPSRLLSKKGLGTAMPRALSYAFDLHDTESESIAPFSSAIINNSNSNVNAGIVSIDSPPSLSTATDGPDSPGGFSSGVSDVSINSNPYKHSTLHTVHSSPLISILPIHTQQQQLLSSQPAYIPPSVLLGTKPGLRRQTSVLVPHTHSLISTTTLPFTESVVPIEMGAMNNGDDNLQDGWIPSILYRSTTHTPLTNTMDEFITTNGTIGASLSSPVNTGTNDTSSISLKLSRLPLTHSIRHDTFNSPLDPSSIAPSSPSTVTDDSSGYNTASQFSILSSSTGNGNKYKSRSFREKLLLSALQQWLDDYANAYKTKKQRSEATKATTTE